MHGEEAIVSLGAVCVSLYQCPPPTLTTTKAGNRSCYGTAADYRGDVMIPFYRGSMTYRDLAAGLEYRLNQYFVIHPTETVEEEYTLKRGLESLNAVPSSVYDKRNSNSSSCCNNDNTNRKCCFNGAYYCSRCSNGDNHVDSVKVQTTETKIKEYPKIVVRNFTRERDRDFSDENIIYETVDDNWEVTEKNLSCFFYSVMVKSTDHVFPIIKKDGIISRPFIGRDHVYAYASDNAYGDNTQLQQHIELKVGERVLRIGTTADQRFEDIFERLRRYNLHVHRLFDGVTGASILPCELVRHLSWKISSLCADIVTSPVIGAGVKRQRYGNDEKEYENDYNIELGTLIILSEVSSTVGGGSTVCLTRDSGNTATAIALDNSDEGEVYGTTSWRHKQERQRQLLMRRTTFGFDDDEEEDDYHDDDTVPLVDLFSPTQHINSHSTVELGEANSALKSYYLDDEDCFRSSGCVRSMNEDDTLPSTTPLRFNDLSSVKDKRNGENENDDDDGFSNNNINNEDDEEEEEEEEEEESAVGDGIFVGDSVKRDRRRFTASLDGVDGSPIIITQQCLPEFCLNSSSSSSYDEEDEEDDDGYYDFEDGDNSR
ncbi:uncharacterized protein TM35_000073140 [Trypanosoma theileri]|uniref:Uncharacterized protein n=1 Tax=Trypanosoma theileri TaxID=67003 RepID=A0A1X0P395_9TRYP|nr:uncharacterized protein TM35_000073140 [Trypanosoma theileri]ORC90890.1 hypothetical protein TM35_000073140 [Trypanosoma theileri]